MYVQWSVIFLLIAAPATATTCCQSCKGLFVIHELLIARYWCTYTPASAPAKQPAVNDGSLKNVALNMHNDLRARHQVSGSAITSTSVSKGHGNANMHLFNSWCANQLPVSSWGQRRPFQIHVSWLFCSRKVNNFNAIWCTTSIRLLPLSGAQHLHLMRPVGQTAANGATVM